MARAGILAFLISMTDLAWRLVLLGRIDLTGSDAGAAERIIVQPKHLALLAYLALEARAESPAFRRRDELASLFWPELDQAHARASLRRVVHQTRAALGRTSSFPVATRSWP